MIMAHWFDYSLRGWLSFLAFMHMGLCLRSFFDSNFLFDKIFLQTPKEMILVHYFCIYSLSQAFILIQSAIHLYVLPLQIVTIFFLFGFISLNLLEAFYFQTLDFYGGTLLPFIMSVISLILLCLFHYVWKPWILMEINEDMKSYLSLHHHHQGHYALKRHNKTYQRKSPSTTPLISSLNNYHHAHYAKNHVD